MTDLGAQAGKELRNPEVVWAIVLLVPETTWSQNSGREIGLGHRRRAIDASAGGTVVGDNEV